MSLTLFTAPGCARCNIAKKFMRAQDLSFDEQDAIGEGKEVFGQFYRARRSAIYRGPEGIEFPVLADGNVIRQGVAAVVAYLAAGRRLDGFIGRSEADQGWVAGLHISKGDPAALDLLSALLGFLKSNGLKLEMETDGRNAAVLRHLLEQRLGDRVIMNIQGPPSLYSAISGAEIDVEEASCSMRLVAKFPEYRFETTMAPLMEVGGVRYLTPDEIAETARWLKEATGSHRQPYVLRVFKPQVGDDERFRSHEIPTAHSFFRHRSAARAYQVLAEVESLKSI